MARCEPHEQAEVGAVEDSTEHEQRPVRPNRIAPLADVQAVAVPSDPSSDVDAADEQMPRVQVTRRRAVGFGLFVLSAVAFLYFVLPKLAGLSGTAHRIERGDTWWIVVGVLLEICFGAFSSRGMQSLKNATNEVKCNASRAKGNSSPKNTRAAISMAGRSASMRGRAR